MLVAILAAVIPVLVGSLLATSPRLLSPSRLGPARTFALFAALAVVLAELLPGAAEKTGALALGLFAVGLVLPALAERVARVRKWFDESGYLTFGRFGRYEYHNSDQCVQRAKQVHAHIQAMAKTGDPATLELP